MKSKSFTVSRFTNPSGRVSWRVWGWDGKKRVRENYPKPELANARKIELEHTFLGGRVPKENLRPTSLTTEQLALAETAMAKLEHASDIVRAVDQFLTGRKTKGPVPDLDEALKQFLAWVDETPTLRHPTKRNVKFHVKTTVARLGNQPLDAVTSEALFAIFKKRWQDASTQRSSRSAVNRFFTWCMEIPRKWITVSPASGQFIKLEPKERGVPQILSLRQAARVLVAAREYRGGIYLRWVVLQLFCGMRPKEADRVRQINLVDGEIHMDARDTKTGEPRTVMLDPIAVAWLKICPEMTDRPAPRNKRSWREFRNLARRKLWMPPDLLRHTCLTHHVRRCGRYAETAEFAGNSERMIRKHYQGRSTKAQSAQFWTWHPDRKQRLLLRAKAAQGEERSNVIQFKAA